MINPLDPRIIDEKSVREHITEQILDFWFAIYHHKLKQTNLPASEQELYNLAYRYCLANHKF